MSKTIEERVVEMRFDNQQFERGVAQSQKSIQNLQNTLDKTSGEKAFSGFSKAINNIDLSGIASGIDSLQYRFSAFGIAGMRVIENLTDKAMNFGSRIMSMTFGQIKSGGKSRATNIENAKFSMLQLLKDANRVDEVMKNVDASVTGTAYGMDQAAKAASVLVSSGFKEGKELEGVLKSIAGVTATANADYDSIAHIFQNIAGQGRIMGQELNEFAARGLNIAEDLAEYYREVKHEANMTAADIRKLMSDPKTNVSSKDFFDAMLWKYEDAAFKANETINGVTNNIRSALSRIGADFYTPLVAANNEIVELLNTVRLRINDIRKITTPYAQGMAQGVLNIAKAINEVLKELDVGTLFNGIANLARPLIDIFKQIGDAFKKVFPSKGLSGLNDSIKNFRNLTAKLQLSDKALKSINKTSTAVFKVLKKGITTVKSLSQSFVNLIKKIPKAELDFSSFFNFKSSLKNFANGFDTIENWILNLKNYFEEGGRGISGVFNVVFESLSAGIEKITSLVKKYTSLDISGITSKIVSGIEKIQTVIVGLVSNLEDTLWRFPKEAWNKYESLSAKVAGVIFEVLKGITKTISDFIYDLTGYDVTEIADKIRKALNTAQEKVTDFCANFKERLIPIAEKLKEIRQYLKDITQIVSPGSLDIFSGLSTNAVSAISFASIIAFIMSEIEKIKTTIDFLTGTVESLKAIPVAIQNGADSIANGLKTIGSATLEINVPSILGVASSLAILAASLYALSKIDSDRLTGTLTAFSVALGELWIVTKNLTTQSSTIIKDLKGLKALERIRFNEVAIQLIEFSVAIFIVAKALEAIGNIESYKITGSLLALTTGMITLMKAFQSIVEYASKMPRGKMSLQDYIKTIIGKNNVEQMFKEMLIFSASIYVLAKAAETLANIPDLEHAIIGIGGIATAMYGLVKVAKEFSKLEISKGNKMLKTSASLIVFGLAVKLLVEPIKELANLEWYEALQGVIGIGLVMVELTGVVIAIDKFTKYKVDKKAFTSMISLSLSVALLANAIKKLGTLPTGQVTQGLIAIGVAMFELVGAIKLFGDSQLATKTAFGFLLLAVSLRIIANAIAEVAAIDIDSLGMGFVALTVVMMEMMAASYLLKDDLLKAGAGFLLLSIGVRAIAGAVTELSTIPLESIGIALLSLTIILAEMVGVIKILGKDPGETLAAASSIAIIAAAIRILAPALTEMSKFKDWTALEQLGGALIVLITAVKFLGEDPKVLIGAAAIAILAGSLLLLAPALKILGTIDGMSAVASLAGALAVLAGAAAIMGSAWSVFLIGAGVLAAFAAVLLIFATGLSIAASALSLMTGTLPTFITELGSLAKNILKFPIRDMKEVFDSLEHFSIFMTGIGIIAGACLAVLGGGLWVLSQAIAELMPFKGQLVSLGEEFSVFMDVISQNTEALTAMAGAMFKIGAAGIVLGIGMAVVVSALNNATPLYEKVGDLITKIQEAVVAISDSINKMADGLVKIGNSSSNIKEAFTSMADGLIKVKTANLKKVADDIEQVGENFSIISSSSVSLKDNLISVNTNLILFQDSVIALNSDLLVFNASFTTLSSTLSLLQTTSSQTFGGMVKEVSDFINTFKTSIEEAAQSVATTASTSSQKVLDAFKKKLSKEQGQWLGEMIMRGLAQGIRKNVSLAVSAAANAASAVNKKIQKVSQVESPSRFTEWVGENQMLGQEKGIKENADKPISAAEDVEQQINEKLASGNFDDLNAEDLMKQYANSITESGQMPIDATGDVMQQIDDMMANAGNIDSITNMVDELGAKKQVVSSLKKSYDKFIAGGQTEIDAVSGEILNPKKAENIGTSYGESMAKAQQKAMLKEYEKLSDEDMIKMGLKPPMKLTAEQKEAVAKYKKEQAKVEAEAYLTELKKNDPAKYYELERQYIVDNIKASITAQKERIKDAKGQEEYTKIIQRLDWATQHLHDSNEGVRDSAQKAVDEYEKMASRFDAMVDPTIKPIVDTSSIDAAQEKVNNLVEFNKEGKLVVNRTAQATNDTDYYTRREVELLSSIEAMQKAGVSTNGITSISELKKELELIRSNGIKTDTAEILNSHLAELKTQLEEVKKNGGSKEEVKSIESQIKEWQTRMNDWGIKEEDLNALKTDGEVVKTSSSQAIAENADKIKTSNEEMTNNVTAGTSKAMTDTIATNEVKSYDEKGYELNTALKEEMASANDQQLQQLRAMNIALGSPIPVNLQINVQQNDMGQWNATANQNDKFIKRTGVSRFASR